MPPCPVVGIRVGVIVTDQAGKVSRVSTDVDSLCKSPDGEKTSLAIQSLGWWDASGNLIDGELAALAAVLDSGDSARNEVIELKCAEGVSKTVLCTASLLQDLTGAVSGAVLVFQYLSDRKALES